MAIAACSDVPGGSEPDRQPAAVTAQATSPHNAYTQEEVTFSANCSSNDGLENVVLEFTSPNEQHNFSREETNAGNTFSESFTKSFSTEGTATLEIRCTSTEGIVNNAQTNTAIEEFKTGLYIELRNATTGELTPGFAYIGEDSLATQTGILDLEITDSAITSITTGLIGKGFGDFGSYLREMNIQPGRSNSLVSYNVDFHFRNPSTNEILGSLATTGYDREGDMDLYRFLLHLEENILRGDTVPRWDGFVPDKVVFADSVQSEVTGAQFAFQNSEEADLLFETWKQQHKEIIQPHLYAEVPFERVDNFVYTSRNSINNIVVIGPESGMQNLAEIVLLSDGARNLGSYISVRDVLPDKETNTINYDAILNRTGLHEIYSALINVGRSHEHTNPEESILISSLALFNQISAVDSKVLYELSQNPNIGSSEKTSAYLILPPGYPTNI